MKNLGTIMKPIKTADEEVRRWYTKASRGISDKVLEKSLAPLSVLGSSLCAGMINYEILKDMGEGVNAFGGITILPLLPNAIYDQFLMIGHRKLNTNKKEVKDMELDLLNRYNSYLRLPLLTTGLATTGRIAYKAVDTILNGAPLDISAEEIMFASGCLSTASSMYLKDRGPKLLEKDPVWKRAYKSAKEKIKSFLPQPTPETIPVEINYQK